MIHCICECAARQPVGIRLFCSCRRPLAPAFRKDHKVEFNKSVSNPMLCGCIELMKADPTPEHQNMFVTELTKAKFLSPAVVTPAPETDAEGKRKLVPGCKIQFPMLTAPDGKNFFMAFTDKMEFDKWKHEEGTPVFALNFGEYAGMVLRKDGPAAGFVINPYSANIVIPKEMLNNLMLSRIAKMKEAQAKQNGGQPPQAGGFQPFDPSKQGK